MQTTLKVFVIVAVAVIIGLGLYVLVQAEFSFSMGRDGFSPGFLWLLNIRAAENGGQIAPSFDELGASGGLPPFMAGGAGGLSPTSGGGPAAALSKGLDLTKAPRVLLRDLILLALAVVIAILFESGLAFSVRLKHRTPAAR